VTDRRSDGQTVGQTESIIAKTALCIASYADALSKMLANLDLKAHGAAGRYNERLVDLFSTHWRVQRAQKELEKTRTANVN